MGSPLVVTSPQTRDFASERITAAIALKTAIALPTHKFTMKKYAVAKKCPAGLKVLRYRWAEVHHAAQFRRFCEQHSLNQYTVIEVSL